MVKVVRVHSFGGPDVLRIDDMDAAAPQPHEVRIRTGAIGLNRIEAVFRAGGFGPAALPARIGYEASGTVEALGAAVSSLRIGDRVATIPGLSMETYGTYADSFVYPADMLVKIPGALDFTASAATWMAFLTAYALAEDRLVAPGAAVIVTAASSSVGLAALQIAAREGGIPIAVTRTREKAAALKAQGAAHVIVSDEEDVAQRILALTNGEGAPVVFDALAGDTIAQLAPAVAPRGTILVYGALRGDTAAVPVHRLMLGGLCIRGFSTNQITLAPPRLQKALAYILEGLGDGGLRPVIDRVFPLDQIAAAHAYLEGNGQCGKVVVTA